MKLVDTLINTLGFLASVSALPSPKNVGLVKIDFNVKRGSNIGDASIDNVPLIKRDSDVGVTIENEVTFYMANLTIGSNKQSVEVLVDTGSSDLWVMEDSVACVDDSSTLSKRELLSPNKTFKNVVHPDGDEKLDFTSFFTTIFETNTASPTNAVNSLAGDTTNTCTSYGSFSTSDSSSFHQNNTVFGISYADGSSADGVWGYDDVTIAGTTINSLSFAVVNQTSSSIGVLGIGLPGLETTYSSGSSFYMYENLPLKMVNQGIINKSLYSLYLSNSSAASGTVLFGAVDSAKYSGTLTTVAIINTDKSSGYDIPLKLQITLSSLVFNNSGTTTTVSDIDYPAILDSGSTLSYFPPALLTNLATALDGTYSSTSGVYFVDCTSDSSVYVQLNFTGAVINVLLSDLILQSGSQCYLGVLTNSDDYILFGDNVLRSAYLVYDLEDYQISLAQAKYTNDENIEVVTSSVPNAVTAQYYSATYSVSGSETTVQTGSKYGTGSSSTTAGTNSKASGAISIHQYSATSALYIYSGLIVSGVLVLIGL